MFPRQTTLETTFAELVRQLHIQNSKKISRQIGLTNLFSDNLSLSPELFSPTSTMRMNLGNLDGTDIDHGRGAFEQRVSVDLDIRPTADEQH